MTDPGTARLGRGAARAGVRRALLRCLPAVALALLLLSPAMPSRALERAGDDAAALVQAGDAVPTPKPRPFAGTPRARPFAVAATLPLPRPTSVSVQPPRARPQLLAPRPAPRESAAEPIAAEPIVAVAAVEPPPAAPAAAPPRPRPDAFASDGAAAPDRGAAAASKAEVFAGTDRAELPPGERQWNFEEAAAMAAAISPAAAPRAPLPRTVLSAAWTSPQPEALLPQDGAVAVPLPPAAAPGSAGPFGAKVPAPRPRPFGGHDRTIDGNDLRMLSDADATLYARAFSAQAEGRWEEADGIVLQIGDPLLMGHLREQRLMHPSDYRASFKELQRWMLMHGDHPAADRVHRLAQARQPAGAALAAPRAPDLTQLDDILARRAAEGAGRGAERARAAGVSSRRGGLGAVRSAYYSGRWERALAAAERLVKAHGAAKPGAAWYAGLSAWRLQRYETAAAHFAALARYDTADSWESAAGAYWAARAYLTLGRPAEAIPQLQAASAHSRTFYGLLAARRLGLDPVFGWRKLSDDPALVEALFQVPAVQRALALAQIGRTERARAELQVLMDARRQAGDSVFLPMLTGLLGLTGDAQTAYRMARIWQIQTGQHIDPAMFPEPPWQPNGGFTFDRALIYAFIRKESRFDPAAKSPVGARGLMQLMPATARFVNGGGANLARILNDPAGNLDLGQRYIRHLERDVGLGSDLIRIAIAYNAGPGNLQKWDDLARHGGDPLLFIESLPSAETRDFVERILANLWVYRARLGQPSPSLDDLARGTWPRYVPLDPDTAREGSGGNAG